MLSLGDYVDDSMQFSWQDFWKSIVNTFLKDVFQLPKVGLGEMIA